MRVVYKKSIAEKVRDAKFEACLQNKAIEYIELTEEEARSLISECRNMFPRFAMPKHLEGTTVFGLRFKIVDNKVS